MELIEKILEHLFGHKYYANIVNMTGTDGFILASYIFRTKEEADKERNKLLANASYRWIETVSFRSRKNYDTFRPFN